mmetsp:Transcript_17830/g.44595  ORF Transcript_17830/g.44595 Transcript_17830/m.44595 type:complete len:333 (+) Transcript_17830:538-1536(+)
MRVSSVPCSSSRVASACCTAAGFETAPDFRPFVVVVPDELSSPSAGHTAFAAPGPELKKFLQIWSPVWPPDCTRSCSSSIQSIAPPASVEEAPLLTVLFSFPLPFTVFEKKSMRASSSASESRSVGVSESGPERASRNCVRVTTAVKPGSWRRKALRSVSHLPLFRSLRREWRTEAKAPSPPAASPAFPPSNKAFSSGQKTFFASPHSPPASYCSCFSSPLHGPHLCTAAKKSSHFSIRPSWLWCTRRSCSRIGKSSLTKCVSRHRSANRWKARVLAFPATGLPQNRSLVSGSSPLATDSFSNRQWSTKLRTTPRSSFSTASRRRWRESVDG